METHETVAGEDQMAAVEKKDDEKAEKRNLRPVPFRKVDGRPVKLVDRIQRPPVGGRGGFGGRLELEEGQLPPPRNRFLFPTPMPIDRSKMPPGGLRRGKGPVYTLPVQPKPKPEIM